MRLKIPDEAGMLDLGTAMARACGSGVVLYLRGELGVGKTTLTRGLLRGLNYAGPVKSPTYTLLESYEIDSRRLYHLDLYRLNAPDELAYIGLRELLDDQALVVVEWPEHGAGYLPPADVVVDIHYADTGRWVNIEAQNARGVALCTALEHAGFSLAQ